MPRKFNISFKERPSARAATKSNIAYGHFQRMAPLNKIRDFFFLNSKGKGKI